MKQSDALAEAVLYIAGGIEQGQIDASCIMGEMLRQLVDTAQGWPDEISIGDVWAKTHEIIVAAWK